MKKIIVAVAASLLTVSAFASDHQEQRGSRLSQDERQGMREQVRDFRGPGPDQRKPDPAKFGEHKERLAKMLDARLEALTKAKACVAKATDHEQLRECHDDMRPPKDGPRGEEGRPDMRPGKDRPSNFKERSRD